MPFTFDSASRFKKTEIISVEGKDTFGRWKRPEFLKTGVLAEQDIMTLNITQQYAGRPDIIAKEFYGSQYLDWVITMYCRPLNTLGWPRAGTTIKIPSPGAVQRNI